MFEQVSSSASSEVELSTVDPYLAAMARGAAMNRELLTRSGGGLTSSQVARVLAITRQAVDKGRTRRDLLAVPHGSGEYLYPACQFSSDGVIHGLRDVLRAFRVRDPWTQLSAILAPAPAAAGKTILEILKAGAIEDAVSVASSF